MDRDAQIELWVESKDHARDDGDGERNQQSGSVHVGFV